MGAKKLDELKEKLKLKRKPPRADEEIIDIVSSPKEKRNGAESSESSNELTQRLKASFHEKQEESPDLKRRKELDQTIRSYRKSFRQGLREGVTTEVKQVQHGVVNGVKQGITTFREIAKQKKKEKEQEEEEDL